MSCYTRHLGDWLPPDPTWLDRRALDEAVRAELHVPSADCPEVWAALKAKRRSILTLVYSRSMLPSESIMLVNLSIRNRKERPAQMQ